LHQNPLSFKAFTAAAIKKVEILKDAFLSNSRQKMLLLQRQEARPMQMGKLCQFNNSGE
jgi:hypothetical protein